MRRAAGAGRAPRPCARMRSVPICAAPSADALRRGRGVVGGGCSRAAALGVADARTRAHWGALMSVAVRAAWPLAGFAEAGAALGYSPRAARPARATRVPGGLVPGAWDPDGLGPSPAPPTAIWLEQPPGAYAAPGHGSARIPGAVPPGSSREGRCNQIGMAVYFLLSRRMALQRQTY